MRLIAGDHDVVVEIVYEPEHDGIDAKGRYFKSNSGYYFTCETCGNSGHHRPEFNLAFRDGIKHMENHA